MTEIVTQFRWSELSQIIPRNVDGGAAFELRPSPGRDYVRNQEMLYSLKALVEQGSTFRMQAGGPAALSLPNFSAHSVLECATAGSSGAPKIIRRSHRSWIESFEQNRRIFTLSADDTYAVLGSLEHSLSLYGVLEAGHIGADVCILAGLRPDRQLQMLADCEITVLYATPTQLEGLVAARKSGQILSKVRRVLIGGGALNSTLASKCQTLFKHARLHPFYGASETSFITIADAQSPEGSVGRAYPNVEISIRTQTGQETDGVGEIWVRSPYLFEAYAQQVARDTRHHDDFISVGEFGYLDDAGNVFLKGRKSRMVTVSDQNVFPDETEQFIAQFYTAGLAAVVAVPDAKRGHRLAVVIEGAAHKSELGVAVMHCRKTLGSHRTPKHILIADTLPLLPSGKLDYMKIEAWSLRQI